MIEIGINSVPHVMCEITRRWKPEDVRSHSFEVAQKSKYKIILTLISILYDVPCRSKHMQQTGSYWAHVQLLWIGWPIRMQHTTMCQPYGVTWSPCKQICEPYTWKFHIQSSKPFNTCPQMQTHLKFLLTPFSNMSLTFSIVYNMFILVSNYMVHMGVCLKREWQRQPLSVSEWGYCLHQSEAMN